MKTDPYKITKHFSEDESKKYSLHTDSPQICTNCNLHTHSIHSIKGDPYCEKCFNTLT